jgi:hypothetical protein
MAHSSRGKRIKKGKEKPKKKNNNNNKYGVSLIS